MRVYSFKSGDEVAMLRINDDVSIEISTSITGYKFKNLYSLFPKEKVNPILDIIKKGNDKDIDKYIVGEFNKMGYVLTNING